MFELHWELDAGIINDQLAQGSRKRLCLLDATESNMHNGK